MITEPLRDGLADRIPLGRDSGRQATVVLLGQARRAPAPVGLTPVAPGGPLVGVAEDDHGLLLLPPDLVLFFVLVLGVVGHDRETGKHQGQGDGGAGDRAHVHGGPPPSILPLAARAGGRRDRDHDGGEAGSGPSISLAYAPSAASRKRRS